VDQARRQCSDKTAASSAPSHAHHIVILRTTIWCSKEVMVKHGPAIFSKARPDGASQNDQPRGHHSFEEARRGPTVHQTQHGSDSFRRVGESSAQEIDCPLPSPDPFRTTCSVWLQDLTSIGA